MKIIILLTLITIVLSLLLAKDVLPYKKNCLPLKTVKQDSSQTAELKNEILLEVKQLLKTSEEKDYDDESLTITYSSYLITVVAILITIILFLIATQYYLSVRDLKLAIHANSNRLSKLDEQLKTFEKQLKKAEDELVSKSLRFDEDRNRVLDLMQKLTVLIDKNVSNNVISSELKEIRSEVDKDKINFEMEYKNKNLELIDINTRDDILRSALLAVRNMEISSSIPKIEMLLTYDDLNIEIRKLAQKILDYLKKTS